MRLPVLFFIAALFLTACSHTYYVVRHAEKATAADGMTMSTPGNPPLSEPGMQRAQALKDTLKDKQIRRIFSTNTIRTMSTAAPLSQLTGLAVQAYGPLPDSAFIKQLKAINSNVLIVGHSNTVDDIVNGLTGRQSVPRDLTETEYDNLFVITYKKFLGTKVRYERKKYGAASQ